MSLDGESSNGSWEAQDVAFVHEGRQFQSMTTRSHARIATIRRSISAPTAQIVLKRLYPHSPLSISDLTQEQMCLYAQILYQPLTANDQAAFHDRTHRLIQNLPESLQNPSPLPKLSQTYVTDMFHFAGASKSDMPASARLCSLHNPMNGQVVASLMTAVEMHVEDFLEDLVSPVLFSSLSPETQSLISTTQDLMAVRLIPREFHYHYKRNPPMKWTTLEYEECDACLLSYIGGREPKILIALRAIAIAALGSRLPNAEMFCPAAQSWFESWMNENDPRNIQRMHMSSFRMAEEIMRSG